MKKCWWRVLSDKPRGGNVGKCGRITMVEIHPNFVPQIGARWRTWVESYLLRGQTIHQWKISTAQVFQFKWIHLHYPRQISPFLPRRQIETFCLLLGIEEGIAPHSLHHLLLLHTHLLCVDLGKSLLMNSFGWGGARWSWWITHVEWTIGSFRDPFFDKLRRQVWKKHKNSWAGWNSRRNTQFHHGLSLTSARSPWWYVLISSFGSFHTHDTHHSYLHLFATQIPKMCLAFQLR